MSVGAVLRDIPWDLLARAASAGVGMVRRARSIRHAERLVEAMEQLGRVPEVDVDAIVDAVVRSDDEGQHQAELERLRRIRADEPTTQHRVVVGGPLDEGD